MLYFVISGALLYSNYLSSHLVKYMYLLRGYECSSRRRLLWRRDTLYWTSWGLNNSDVRLADVWSCHCWQSTAY